MPGELSLTIEGSKALLDRFDKLPAKIRDRVGTKALTRGSLILESHIRAQKLSGQSLRVRSGRLRSSITHRIAKENNDLVARVGTNVIYAKIHEYGGTIKPKHAQHLTIPLDAAMTPSGVARYKARDLISQPSIGGFKRTFFRNKVLFGVKHNGRVVPVFALKKSVTIKEKRFMRDSLKEKARQIILEVFNSIRDALEGK